MGKKKKKNIQKRKQAKALKRRSKKKVLKKKSPVRAPRIPMGIPGNIPPGKMGMAKTMLMFSNPLMEMAEPQTEDELQSVMLLAQGFWNAFIEKDIAKRQKKLEQLRGIYSILPWAAMDFDELTELLLKRHIFYFPEGHSQEELQQFTEEEIREAVAAEITPTLSPQDIQFPEFDPKKLPALLDEEEAVAMEEWQEKLADKYDRIEFTDERNPDLEMLLDYQELISKLFVRYMEQEGMEKTILNALYNSMDSFFSFFLKDYQQHSLWTCTPDDVEEFILDFYIRKVTSTPDAEEILPQTFRGFFTFVEKMGFVKDTSEILERIEECEEESRN